MHVYLFVAALFFLCGFSTTFMTTLALHSQDLFQLGRSSSTALFASFYLATLIAAPIAAQFYNKVPITTSMRAALSLAFLGSAGIYAGSSLGTFTVALPSVFAMGCGLWALQVIMNPYSLHYGDQESGASRLSILQGFFALGMLLALYLGTHFTLKTPAEESGPFPISAPYLIVAVVWVILLAIHERFPLKKIKSLEEISGKSNAIAPALLILGVSLIAVAIGVETALGHYLIPFLSERTILDTNFGTASQLVFIYWVGFTVGRFASGLLFQGIPPRFILYFHAGTGLLLLLITCITTGGVAALAALATGLSTSVLFPTLYALFLEESSGAEMRLSGYLVMASTGGALVPLFQGAAADLLGIHLSFLIPAICFGAIFAFSLRRPRMSLQPIRVKVTRRR